MRILIYSINYFPEPTGIGKYNGEMAEWLANHGHEVVMITALPYYPWWRVQQPYRSWLYRTELINKVTVHRCPLWVPRHPTGFTRLLHLTSFAFSSIPALLTQWRWKPTVVLCIAPALMNAPFALAFGRLTGAKTWLHIQPPIRILGRSEDIPISFRLNGLKVGNKGSSLPTKQPPSGLP